MSYFEEWNLNIEKPGENGKLSNYAETYYTLEKEAYRRILAAFPEKKIWEGKASDIAEKLGFSAASQMDIFTGFLDGINDCIKESMDLQNLDDETQVRIEPDFEKLYFKMHDVSAKWLYELEEWNKVYSEEEQLKMTKDYRRAHIAVSNKIGRNDPCPCGSGKKYKNCHGKKGSEISGEAHS